MNDMNKMHLTEDVVLPRDLITAHRKGDLVIFVGAGASVDPPSRLPLFKELTRRLAERASVPFEETIDDNECSYSFFATVPAPMRNSGYPYCGN